MLGQLQIYMTEINAAYDTMNFNRAANCASQFLNGTVSNFYCTTVKDRIYCDAQNSNSRRSAQTVLKTVGRSFVSSVAPILPHLGK